MSTFKTIATLALACAAYAHAAEALRYPDMAPFGMVLGHQQQSGAHGIQEFVPEGETVDNWSRMLTFNTSPTMPVAQFQSTINQLWAQACPKSNAIMIREGKESGYPFAFWMLTCEHNPATGKPEYTWLKALEGQETLFVTQFAFRYVPSEMELYNLTQWLAQVAIEDVP